MERFSRIARALLRYAYSLLCAIYMYTLGMATKNGRRQVYEIANQHGFSGTKDAPRLPSVEPDEVTDPATPVVLHELIPVDGNLPLEELVVIARLVKQYAPSAIFEIGTFDGRTTLNLAANAPADAEIVTLDLPAADVNSTALPIASGDVAYVKKPRSGDRFRGTEYEQRISQVYGDSATFDFGPYESTIDLVFVDGSHSYEYVVNDTERAKAMLRDGKGWILWDDYGVWDGVTSALDELHRTDPDLSGIRHVRGTPLAVAHLT